MATREAIFKQKTGFKTGKLISSRYGEVYNIVGHPNKVAKIVPIHLFYLNKSVKKVLKVLSYLKKTDNKSIAKIYKCGEFVFDGQPHFYYIMEKLYHIRGADYLLNKIEDYEYYLKNKVKVSKVDLHIKRFVTLKNQLKYYHGDYHSGNIMKTKSGAIKFIDLESFSY